MIKKIIHFADLHIPNDEKERPYGKMIKSLLKQVITEVKKGNPEETRIVIAGDVFKNKIRTTNEAKIIFHELLNVLNKVCRTYVFAGNHDMLENNLDRTDSITPTFTIDNVYDNVVFLDRELEYKSGLYEDNNVIFMLFSMFDDFAKPESDGIREANKDKRIIGLYHGDMVGTVTDVGRMSDAGIDANVFKDCDCVMAGHIHKYQTLKKNGVPIVYAGSVFQQDFGENTTGHGFVVWNLEDMSYTHVEVDNDYKLYKFSITDYEDVDNDTEKLLNL